jgi:hypothetical protein
MRTWLRDGRWISLLACVALVVAFAAPTAFLCVASPDGHRVCSWVIDRTPSTDDWRSFAGAWEAARIALRDFHQWPSWNPYHCGGVPLYQDPQTPVPGVMFLLTFAWLPTPVAMKLWLYVHLLVGALGARALLRHHGANIPEQVFGAALVTACGFCSEHFGGGHLSFTPFLFLPWALLGHRRALKDARWSVLTAAVLAMAVWEGGTYPVPLLLVALAADTILRLGDPAARRAFLVTLPLTGVLFALLAGVRLLPVLLWLREHPRLMPLDDSMTVAEVVLAWTARAHERPFPGHIFVWPEYGDYIGAVPVALFFAAVVAAFARRDDGARDRRVDVGVGLALVWCALGNIPGFSLFGLLHELPVYRSLRVPSRFLYPATVLLALVAGRALADLRALLLDHRPRRALARSFVALECALALGVVIDLVAVNSPRLQVGADPPIPGGRASTAFHQEGGGDYWRWPTYPVRAVGTPVCYVAFDWTPAPQLWQGEGPQQRVEPADGGTARSLEWSPNVLRIEVDLARPATLLVNQNTDSGWSTSLGTIDRAQALLAVALPAGRHTVTLTHAVRGLWAGALFTLLGMLASAWVLRRAPPERVERWRSALAGRLFVPDSLNPAPPEPAPSPIGPPPPAA